MLPKVSRTFAMCIRLLPPNLEHAVLVAYLLCRVADTLEDTTLLDPLDKTRLLALFSRCLDGGGPNAESLRDAFAEYTADDELLVREVDRVLREYHRLPQAQQTAIKPWVQEMCAGMAGFAGRPGSVSPERLASIATVEDLDRYCYYVAGTVGHLLTELFRQHHPSVTAAHYDRMKSLATSFGVGLQLTNIIKDVADDRRRGMSFVPRQLCHLAGISPEDVQDGCHKQESRQVMELLIDKAKGHLCDALDYTTSLPRRQYRIRLFCLTSFYFAVRTLRLAEGNPQLVDPNHKVKITRADVRHTIVTAKLVAPINSLVRRYFRQLAGEAWWRRSQTRRRAATDSS